MTYEEASDGIKTWLGYMRKSNEGDDFANEFIDCAEFMTKSVVREALEKQIPKKVIKYKRIGDVLIGGYCPACGAELHISNRPCYCGQVLNWDGVK